MWLCPLSDLGWVAKAGVLWVRVWLKLRGMGLMRKREATGLKGGPERRVVLSGRCLRGIGCDSENLWWIGLVGEEGLGMHTTGADAGSILKGPSSWYSVWFIY